MTDEQAELERLAAESVGYALGHRVCPSCAGLLGACCRCRGAVPLALQAELVPDLVEYVRGGLPEPREHLLCAPCLREQASELEDLRRDALARGRASLSELEREVFLPRSQLQISRAMGVKLRASATRLVVRSPT